MKFYAGLDVAVETTALCLVDQTGEIVCEATIATDPEEIWAYLSETGLVFERIGFEAGPCSSWLYKRLTEYDLPAVCIDARHAHAALKAQNVKTDRNDARGIAHIVRTGWFRVSHVRSNESAMRRVLLNSRKTLLSKRLELENHIRGNLKVFGLKVGAVTARGFEARVQELIKDDADLLSYVEPLLRVRGQIQIEINALDKKIRHLVKEDPVCRRFMTIPGVGPLTALLFKSTVDDPQRFAKSANVAVHLGLTPRKYASGEIDFNGRIAKTGDQMTRTHLYEAAQVLMRRSSAKNALKSWGAKIAKRGSTKRAYVAVARKLAVIMHRMWIDGTDFDGGTAHTA
ncbi:MAG: IS110 family transposase [Pseudomonadota bacterium]